MVSFHWPQAGIDHLRPLCPECRAPMVKAGRVWSSRTAQKQQYLCKACRRRTIAPVLE